MLLQSLQERTGSLGRENGFEEEQLGGPPTGKNGTHCFLSLPYPHIITHTKQEETLRIRPQICYICYKKLFKKKKSAIFAFGFVRFG